MTVDLPPSIAALVERSGEGRIRVVRSGVTRFVWYAGGKIHAVTSSSDAEKLGGWLVARGLADRRVVQDALARKAAQERLGALLVRCGVIRPPRLGEELASLSYTITSRLLAEGGELADESGWRLPPDAKTVDAGVVALFIEAVERTPDIDPLVRLVGDGKVWEAATAVDRPVPALSESQRYLLTLLRPAKTLDALRRVVLQEYADVVRDLAALVAAGLVVPRVAPANGLATRTASGAGSAVARSPVGGSPLLVPAASPRRPVRTDDSRVRSTLAGLEREVDAAGATRRGFVGAEGALRGAALRRAEALLQRAEREVAAGDPRAAMRTLMYGAETVPCAVLHVKLAEIEAQDLRLQQHALDHLKRALVEAPAFAPAWLALAAFWASRERADKQRRCLERARAIDSDREPTGEVLVTTS